MSNCKHYSNLPSVVNKPVFKDQCGRCYDNPRSDHGIDICLICLQAYCKSDIFDHSEKHRQVNFLKTSIAKSLIWSSGGLADVDIYIYIYILIVHMHMMHISNI